MAEVGSKRSLHLRLDARLHDQLQQLASESGCSIPDLTRELLERAFNDRTHLELLAQSKRTTEQLECLEHNVAQILPWLHQRLGTLEQLVCAVDANAFQRAPIEHIKLRRLWRNTRCGMFELQRMAIQVLQQTMHTNGHKLEESKALIDKCQEGAESDIVEFVPEIRAIMAEYDKEAPPPLQPPPPPELPPILRPPAGQRSGEAGTVTQPDVLAVDLKHGDAPDDDRPDQEQPSLFAGNGATPPGSNGASNGSGEVGR